MTSSFSIVTPSYNQIAWLDLARASVRDQVTSESRLTIEHLIQDALTPGIHELENSARLSALGKDSSDPKYTLDIVSEKDAGMYDAVNRGLKRSKGTYIAYLNCDEQYLPGTLEKVVRFFERHPDIDMVFGDVLLVNQEGQQLAYRRPVLPNRIHTRLCHLGTLTCATFFRASLLQKDLFFNEKWKIIGDAEWMVRCLDRGVRMSLIPAPLSVFAFTGKNLSDDSHHAEGEKARWQAAADAPPRWLKWPAILHHRTLKFLAGAYRRRDLEYRIYTLNSPATRQTFTARSLGSKWRG